MPGGNRAFPKDARLLTKREFQRVFDGGCKAADRLLVVFALRNGGGGARLGLAISRKCARRAVDRNRIKRAVREAFRLARPTLGDLDYVVLCRAAAVETPGPDLAASLLVQLRKVSRRPCALS